MYNTVYLHKLHCINDCGNMMCHWLWTENSDLDHWLSTNVRPCPLTFALTTVTDCPTVSESCTVNHARMHVLLSKNSILCTLRNFIYIMLYYYKLDHSSHEWYTYVYRTLQLVEYKTWQLWLFPLNSHAAPWKI